MSSGGNCTRRLSWDLIPAVTTITLGAVDMPLALLPAELDCPTKNHAW